MGRAFASDKMSLATSWDTLPTITAGVGIGRCTIFAWLNAEPHGAECTWGRLEHQAGKGEAATEMVHGLKPYIKEFSIVVMNFFSLMYEMIGFDVLNSMGPLSHPVVEST